eukprot:SAG11_NODE_32387_length_284_cov_0.562162_1_plen_67_part_01
MHMKATLMMNGQGNGKVSRVVVNKPWLALDLTPCALSVEIAGRGLIICLLRGNSCRRDTDVSCHRQP